MPSHISHAIFAEDLYTRLTSHDFETASASENSEIRRALTIGAQGPDIFYHNQRSMPSGLLIGSLLHRKGYGSVCARMLEHCLIGNHSSQSPNGAYVIAFISHAVLDRIFHPYINYFAGWPNQADGSEEYRHCHPFMERIVDLAIAAYRRPSLNGESLSKSFAFASNFDAESPVRDTIEHLLLQGLKGTYRRISQDPELERRIANAYRDSRGFYYYCEQNDQANGDVRWASLLHPARLPKNIDFANVLHTRWCDPCDQHIGSSESLYQLYDRALSRAMDIIGPVASMLDGGEPPENYPGTAVSVGDYGLRSDAPSSPDYQGGAPVPLIHSDPLPLSEVLNDIAHNRQKDDWTESIGRFREQCTKNR